LLIAHEDGGPRHSLDDDTHASAIVPECGDGHP
jgi:hypothetical protein